VNSASGQSGSNLNDAATIPPPHGRRALPAVAERVLVIGLDGATMDVLGPLMDEGFMPRLAEVVRGGATGVLWSTVPPVTPAAWTTFLTGKNPGAHGALDFEYYDAKAGLIRFHSTRSLGRNRNLWQILSDKGFRVGSVNVPLTYPPITLENGFVVSGFETPGPQSDFVSPPRLREEILARWPDPTLKSKWKREVGGGDELFQHNLDYISASFHQGADMTIHLGEQGSWDVLMVVFKLVDNLQHKTWKYIDPRWRDRAPARRDAVKACFARLDEAIGKLLDYAATYRASILMVSDHGHGSMEGTVYPNVLLKRWGYLHLQRGWPRLRAQLARLIRRKSNLDALAQPVGIEKYVPADLARTRACVMHAGNGGFLFVNLKGRQPTGIVDPCDYEAIRDDLQARLQAERATDPTGQVIQVFPEVHKPEELYGCTRLDQPWMPDLILIQHDPIAVGRRIKGRNPMEWLSYGKLEGTHRKEGILIARGPGIACRNGVSANIVDCAPTILAMMGLRIPDDMHGRVITDLFEKPPRVERAAAEAFEPVEAPTEVYTEAELAEVTDRLVDLGYME